MCRPGSISTVSAAEQSSNTHQDARRAAHIAAELAYPYRQVLGMRVDGTSYEAATELILRWASAGESRYICEAPVHMVMEAFDCPAYQTMINRADLVTPGGMPLVWMLRALGLRGQPRVYGPDLMLQICRAAARCDIAVGFYGGTQRTVTILAQQTVKRFPELQIRYVYSPPFRVLTADEKANVVETIKLSGCRILFVGLGCPKQERWMAEHKSVVPAVMIGVGAAFDFLSGQKPQASPWMQRVGLEWLFRLVTEPRRLWFRYLYHNPRFMVLALGQLALEFLSRKPAARSSPSVP